MTTSLRPPFTRETALAKVRAAEDAWNSRDPVRVSLAYSADSTWRNRDQFVTGRSQIQEFLAGKWQRERDYTVAVRFPPISNACLWLRNCCRPNGRYHSVAGRPRPPPSFLFPARQQLVQGRLVAYRTSSVPATIP
jgi:hypothetical protein